MLDLISIQQLNHKELTNNTESYVNLSTNLAEILGI